jgi:hypothetical protein
MKKYIFIILLGIICNACEYDNYDPPTLTFTGNLMYNNSNFLYDGNAGRPVLRFYQSGFGLSDAGTVARIDQNGHFSQLFFSGDYKLTLQNTMFPFEFKDFTSKGSGKGYDTISIKLNTSIERNFDLIPYYTISDLNAVVSGTDIVATFNATTVVNAALKNPTPTAIKARLYVSTTPLVTSVIVANAVNSSISFNSGTNQVTVTMPVSKYRTSVVNNTKTYGWYRVALELQNIPNYYLFSDIKKLDGIPL